MQETTVWFLGWEDPLRRERLPTPVFWPRKFHGLCSPQGGKELDMTERLSLAYSKEWWSKKVMLGACPDPAHAPFLRLLTLCPIKGTVRIPEQVEGCLCELKVTGVIWTYREKGDLRTVGRNECRVERGCRRGAVCAKEASNRGGTHFWTSELSCWYLYFCKQRALCNLNSGRLTRNPQTHSLKVKKKQQNTITVKI